MTDPGDRWAVAVAAGRRAGRSLSLSAARAARAPVGERLGALGGDSIEFMEHRAYEPGDDLRRVDWGVYARTDALVVRRYHAEVSPRLDLFIDDSRSMDRPGTVKADAAVAVAAALIEAARRDGLRPRSFLAGTRARPLPEPPASFAQLAFDGRTGAAPDLRAAAGERPGLRILITDTLFPSDPAAALRPLARGGVSAALVCVLTRDEREPERLRGRRLIDAETGERSDIEVNDRVIDEYRARLARHLSSWASAARATGVAFAELTAEDAFDGRSLAIGGLLRSGLAEARP